VAREILAMDEDGYRVTFKGSAMTRATRTGLRRNAAVVLGNVGTLDDKSMLEQAAAGPDPLVAEHAVWALRRIGFTADLDTEHRRNVLERDPPASED
jgi:epoxyqueuosine reductase